MALGTDPISWTDAIIANAVNLIQSTTEQATTYVQAAVTAAQNATYPNPVADIPVPNISVSAFLPVGDWGQDFLNVESNDFISNQPLAWTTVKNYVDTFFPGADTVQADFQAWVETNLNGGTGLPAQVEQQMYGRELDRLTIEARKQKWSAQNEVAARGFMAPPGALNDKILQINKEASAQLAGAGRDLREQQAKQHIQVMLEAAQLASTQRERMMMAANEFFREFFAMESIAIMKGDGYISARRSFYDASRTYYDTLISSGNLNLSARRANQEKQLGFERLGQEAILERTRQIVNSSISAAEVLGRIGSAAAAAQNTIAGIHAIETYQPGQA